MEDLEQAVLNGREVENFLQNPVIRSVFTELDRTYYNKWRSAATPEDREALWQQARALDVLGDSLQAVADAGKRVTIEAERATRPAI